jgi:cytochrome c-type biogenesis protein CcmH/NrfG
MKLPRFALFLILNMSLASLAAAESAEGLLAEGKADAAIAALRDRIASSPNDAEAHAQLCRAYYSIQDWDHAISSGEKAVNLSPDQSNYHLWLGRAYGEKADASSFFSAAGLAKKVRISFERAVELDGSNIAARSDLAEFYMEAPGIMGGGQDKARAQADALMKRAPAKAHWVLGRLAEKNKDTTVAEQEYKAALEATHNGAEGWLDLAIFYRRTSRMADLDSAIEKLNAAPIKNTDVLVDAAANLLRSEHNLPMAAQLLKRYLAGKTVEDAPAFRAHMLLGTVYEKQGDKKAASTEFQAALALASTYKPARDGLKRVGA